MGTIDGRRLPQKPDSAAGHSVALAVACLITYWLITHLLARVHSVSRADDLLGAMWAVIATVFVYRESHRESVSAALSRASATALGFAVCLIYLLLFSFHPVGLAVLIGLTTFLLTLIGRAGDVVTAAVTVAVVLVVAAISPDHAWEQPILRAVDTGVGIAVGLAASALAVRVSPVPGRRR